MNNTNHFPSPGDSLPSIPASGEHGPDVCATIRLYMAVQNDLTPEQQRVVSEHIHTCVDCAEEQRILNRSTQLVADFARLTQSEPSSRVDQAIMAAIAAHTATGTPAPIAAKESQAQPPTRIPTKTRRPIWLVGQLVAAALILLALISSVYIFGIAPHAPWAFQLPQNLSWNGYVLYHTQTEISTNGIRYRIETYDDLSTGRMHVETTIPDQLDVVVVGEDHKMLGMDMLHHVAQWGADAWSVDDSIFNLAALRSDLQAKRAVYLDEDTFRGQPVYRIRLQNGLVLLLNMQYQPVNVLQGALGPGTGGPMYDTLKLMPSSQVSPSMWNMTIPQGFRMGTLPPKP
jgi:hypothetical protein